MRPDLKVADEEWRKNTPNKCPVLQVAGGVGKDKICWLELVDGVCSTHGRIYYIGRIKWSRKNSVLYFESRSEISKKDASKKVIDKAIKDGWTPIKFWQFWRWKDLFNKRWKWDKYQ